METIPKNTIFAKAPSWLLAVFIFILSAIVFVITDSIWTLRSETGLKSYLINNLITISGCFFIVKLNPKRIWYVPPICNALLIISSILEPNFWRGSNIITICAGWVLSIAASVIAAQQAKAKQNV